MPTRQNTTSRKNFALYLNKLFYQVKPIIPRSLQIMLRRELIRNKRSSYIDVWPIDENAKRLPRGWKGWPEQKRFAFILSHDIDTLHGQNKCIDLLKLDKRLGFRSSFSFVPERYDVQTNLFSFIRKQGFDICVHGLYHDEKLFSSKKAFDRQAIKINEYIDKWETKGFTSPSAHHNLEWTIELKIQFAITTFDTDPFEPQPDGVKRIFPFWVNGNPNHQGYVELPYTLPQDFTLFILMKEKSIDIWKQKLDWIVENGGMALLNTHPDYINFSGKKLALEEYPAEYYEEFLNYVKTKYDNQYWHVLPSEMASFWKKNMMQKNIL